MQFDESIVDAAINRWHHCVNAFDRNVSRLYLCTLHLPAKQWAAAVRHLDILDRCWLSQHVASENRCRFSFTHRKAIFGVCHRLAHVPLYCSSNATSLNLTASGNCRDALLMCTGERERVYKTVSNWYIVDNIIDVVSCTSYCNCILFCFTVTLAAVDEKTTKNKQLPCKFCGCHVNSAAASCWNWQGIWNASMQINQK